MGCQRPMKCSDEQLQVPASDVKARLQFGPGPSKVANSRMAICVFSGVAVPRYTVVHIRFEVWIHFGLHPQYTTGLDCSRFGASNLAAPCLKAAAQGQRHESGDLLDMENLPNDWALLSLGFCSVPPSQDARNQIQCPLESSSGICGAIQIGDGDWMSTGRGRRVGASPVVGVWGSAHPRDANPPSDQFKFL